MTCIYCNSSKHRSNKCDIYDTPEYRKEIHLWTQCCGFSIHPDSHAFWCHNKPANKKCYICFEKGTHLTVHCIQRLTVPKWFMPKIDRALLSRFFKLFDPLELFSFVRRSPVALNYVKLNNIKISGFSDFKSPSVLLKMMIKEPDSILIFMRNRICVYEKSDVLKLYRMKNVYFRITSFEIDSKISSEDFLRHLTLTTRRLICMYSEITPKIELAEILGKVRNIEQLVLTRYNTVIQKDWPQNLLKYIDGQNLKRFSFQIDSLDFNVGDLVSVMTQKSVKNVKIELCYAVPNNVHRNKAAKNLKQNLSKHFIQVVFPIPELSVLCIYFFTHTSDFDVIGYFVLNHFENVLTPENFNFGDKNYDISMPVGLFGWNF